MKTETTLRTHVVYEVQVPDARDQWRVVKEFSGNEFPLAFEAWNDIRDPTARAATFDPNARIVQTTTHTTVHVTEVAPFEWTEERGRCHHNGFTDHDAHVIDERRGQYCRGNGPWMEDKDWRPNGGKPSVPVP